MSSVENVGLDTNWTTHPVSLPLGDNGDDIVFTNVDKLKEYIDREKNKWSWLGQPQDVKEKPIRNILLTINNDFIQKLNDIANSWEKENEEELKHSITLIKEILSVWAFPSSNLPIGRYIFDLSENQESVAAQLWFLHISPIGSNSTTNNSFIIKKHYDSYFSRGTSVLTTAHYVIETSRLIASSHLTKISSLLNDSSEKWVDSIKDTCSQITNVSNESQVASSEFENWLSQRQSDIETKIKDYEKTVNSRFQKFAQNSLSRERNRLREAKNIQNDAEKQLEAAKNAYRSEIDLDESVGYWNDKKTEHLADKDKWIFRLYFSIGCTAIIPFLTFGLQCWFLHLGWIKTNDLLMATIHPSIAAIGLILLSLGSYVIKFSSQQYQTQQHLYLEAVERRTMIKTYLALLSEGKLDGHEDRKVALDTLFRPAQTGMVKEQSTILPTEQIVKIIAARAK